MTANLQRGNAPPTRLDREAAINLLRHKLLEMTDDDHCACSVAAAKGIMCRGFKHYDDAELRRKYWWLMKGNSAMPREELERLANRWQLARQVYHDLPISCDVQRIERDTCDGWASYSNEELQSFLYELTGISAEIT